MPLELPEPLRLAWGLRLSDGILEICPDPSRPDLPAVQRLRCGRTLVDLALRSRPGRRSIRLARRFGPPLPVRVSLSGLEPVQVTVDEHPIPGSEVSLLVEGEHEVAFYC